MSGKHLKQKTRRLDQREFHAWRQNCFNPRGPAATKIRVKQLTIVCNIFFCAGDPLLITVAIFFKICLKIIEILLDN